MVMRMNRADLDLGGLRDQIDDLLLRGRVQLRLRV